jgi:hypothetical protein
MTAPPVIDALVMATWRRGAPNGCCITPNGGSQRKFIPSLQPSMTGVAMTEPAERRVPNPVGFNPCLPHPYAELMRVEELVPAINPHVADPIYPHWLGCHPANPSAF